MALIPRSGRFSLVHSYDLRKVREKRPSDVLSKEAQGSSFQSPEPTTLVKMESSVERVSFYSETDQNGKNFFSVVLELDPELNPSNQTRRTEAVRGLALDAEEKDLAGLARLSGRRVEILLERKVSHLDFERLLQENEILAREVLSLRQKNSSLSDQLQFAVESNRRTY